MTLTQRLKKTTQYLSAIVTGIKQRFLMLGGGPPPDPGPEQTPPPEQEPPKEEAREQEPIENSQ